VPAPALFALLVVAVLWGSAFPLIKVGLDGLSVPHLTLLRHLVASLGFLVFLIVGRARLFPERRDWGFFVLLGFLGIFVYHTALNAGELRVSAGATSLIIATAPGITALLAHFILGQRMPWIAWLGSATSFAGVALIALGDTEGLRLDPFAGFVLLAAASTSLYFVLQQRLFARYRPLEVISFVTWGGTLPMLAFLPGLPSALQTVPAPSFWAAVYIGIFPSAIAYSLFTYAQTRMPILLVATFLYSVPVFSLSLSWWILGEVPSSLTLVGGVIAIAGIVVVQRARERMAALASAR